MAASTKAQKTRSEAWQLALKLLAARSLSVAELRRKLRSRGVESGTVEVVIQELEARRYLDDEKLSELYIQTLIERKAYGRRWFFHKLLQRGIDKQVIEEALDKVFDQVSESDLAFRAASSKLAKLQADEPKARPAKLARFLRNRGFSEGLILQVVRDRLSRDSDAEYEDGA